MVSDVQKALLEIQMLMNTFITENITMDNFQGRSVNYNGNERLYFKVTTRNGKTMYMVICSSDILYWPTTASPHRIRTLMTVYFETEEDFNAHGLLETKKEMIEDYNKQKK